MSTLTWTIIATLAIELLTIIGRLTCGPYNKIHKKSGAKLRIHHGYYGILLLVVYWLTPETLINGDILLIAGSSLLISDAIHHFIVLPIWVGRTEFPN